MVKEFSKILIATSSEGKVREYKQLFSDVEGVEFVTLKDVFGDNLPEGPEETGETFMDNAMLKAKYWSEKSGLPALADDSGICVDALDGFPGVRSKRFCKNYDDPKFNDKFHNQELLNVLHTKGFTESMASYECAIVLYNAEVGRYYHAYGCCKGKYSDKYSTGHNGFAFDNHFWAEAYNYTKTLADISTNEKNKISHRGLAVKELKENMKLNKVYVVFGGEEENE